MVLATFGCKVKILLCQEGLSLLRNQQAFNTVEHAFKLANNIVESFEFYDLFPILIDQNDRESAFVKNTQYELEYVELCRDFLDEFDHILYW